MPLFTFPKYKSHSFKFSEQMILCTDHYESNDGRAYLSVTDPTKYRSVKGMLDASQVKKFDQFPDLLGVELDNEELHPDIAVLDKDIFDAIFNNDYMKFFRCVARVGYRPDFLDRIYSWLMSKEKFEKRDVKLLKRIEGCRSVFNIFDY